VQGGFVQVVVVLRWAQFRWRRVAALSPAVFPIVAPARSSRGLIRLGESDEDEEMETSEDDSDDDSSFVVHGGSTSNEDASYVPSDASSSTSGSSSS
jgi:hypothetical protein